MLKCPKCKRITEKSEPTGTLRLIENLKPKGKRIISSKMVCMDCSGEKLTK